MAPQSSTLAWKIPWTEEPGRLQSMGSLRVGHDWATSLSLFAFVHWRRRWQPTPVFLPGESQGRGSLVGCRLRGHTVGHDWSDLAAAAEAAGWAPASSNQETPVPQGHRPQRGTTALGPRGPPLHCPPASNPCLVPWTRKALLAVLGSSLLFFFSSRHYSCWIMSLTHRGQAQQEEEREGHLSCCLTSTPLLVCCAQAPG